MNYDTVVGATVGSDGQVRLDIWIILDNAQSSLKKKHLSHENFWSVSQDKKFSKFNPPPYVIVPISNM